MPAITLGAGETHRRLGKLPHLRQRNVLLERDPSNAVDGLVLLQRPGLAPFITVGDGPINGVWRQAGTFGGSLIVSGAMLARVSDAGAVTTLGTISATRVQIVASATRAIIVSGEAAYSTDGATVTTLAMPDGEAVGSVAFLDGYFFLSVLGGQRVYYIEPGQDAPDGLAFFEAERKPDPIVTLGVLGDELWLIGSESEEVWTPSGDADAPVQRISARAYQNGCVNRDTLVDLNGMLGWVSSDFEVIVSRGAPEAVSNAAIVEHLRAADPATMRAWTYALDGHLLYVLTTDRDTLVYDFSTQLWSRFSSEDSDVWRAHLGSGLLAGDSQSGALWRLDPQRSNDAGLTFTRELSGGVEIVGLPQRCNSVAMRAAVGWAAVGVSPVVEMAWSDDEGVTWTEWQPKSLGLTGQFRAPVVWRKLGMMKRPGRLFRWRMTDDAVFRLSHITYNEAFA